MSGGPGGRHALRRRLGALAGLLVLVSAVGVGVSALGRDPDRLAARGREALDAHDLAAAEALFRRALAGEPTHRAAMAGLGWTYLLAGQQAAAAAAFERCVELDAADAECLRGQASAASAQGEAGKARTLLQRAVEAHPHDPGVQASLALLDLSEGDLQGAALRYESLVARFPDQAEYALGLGETRLRQGRLDEARAVVDAALDAPIPVLRYRAMLLLLRARVLVASVAGRADPARCAETAPPLLAWLDAADAAVDEAEATGVRMPTLGETRRLVGRSRGQVEDTCPGIAVKEGAPSGAAAGG